MGAYQSNRTGAHALQLGVLLQDQEQLEHGERVARERAAVDHLEIAVAGLEAAVDRHRVTQLVVQQNGLFEQLQQHLVEALHLHDPSVIVLHELFDGEVGVFIGVAELLGQRALVFKQQAVFMPAGQQVQAVAHAPQVFFAALELAEFVIGQKAVFDQRFHGADTEVALGDPADRLDVA